MWPSKWQQNQYQNNLKTSMCSDESNCAKMRKFRIGVGLDEKRRWCSQHRGAEHKSGTTAAPVDHGRRSTKVMATRNPLKHRNREFGPKPSLTILTNKKWQPVTTKQTRTPRNPTMESFQFQWILRNSTLSTRLDSGKGQLGIPQN